jgi:hypothetical protein
VPQDLGKLVDGVVGSNSDKHMWIGRIGGDSPLDVCIRLNNAVYEQVTRCVGVSACMLEFLISSSNAAQQELYFGVL